MQSVIVDKNRETCYNVLCKVGRAQHLIRKQVESLRQTVAVDGNPDRAYRLPQSGNRPLGNHAAQSAIFLFPEKVRLVRHEPED